MNPVRRNGQRNGILSTEVVLNEADGDGNGYFVTVLEPNAINRHKHIATFVGNDQVRCAIGIHSDTRQVIILVGGAGVGSESRAAYLWKIAEPADVPWQFEATISDWRIIRLKLNGNPLSEATVMGPDAQF